MKETLKIMLVEFFIILSGTTICSAVFCTVFYPGVALGVGFLWELIILAFLTTLPQLLFYSKKEFSKKHLRVRQTVHVILVVGLLVFLAYFWGWIEFSSVIEPLAFIVLVLLTYTAVALFMHQKEKKLAARLNEKLREFRSKEE